MVMCSTVTFFLVLGVFFIWVVYYDIAKEESVTDVRKKQTHSCCDNKRKKLTGFGSEFFPQNITVN